MREKDYSSIILCPLNGFVCHEKQFALNGLILSRKTNTPGGGGLTNREANDKCIKRCFAPSMDR